MRKNIEARMRIEEALRKELEAVKVSIVLINPIFVIIRCSNLWPGQCDIDENLLEGQVLLRHVIELLAAKSIGITIAYILVWLTYTQSTDMGTNIR